MMKENVSPISLIMLIKNRYLNIMFKHLLILGIVIVMGCQPNQNPALDLSSPEKSAEVIMTALQNNDVKTFKKCLTSRIIKKVEKKADLHKFLDIWEKNLELFSGPADFARGVKFSQENGQWKMDET